MLDLIVMITIFHENVHIENAQRNTTTIYTPDNFNFFSLPIVSFKSTHDLYMTVR